MDTIEKLAPYTVGTHLKDVAVDAYDEGILLSEVILGEGLIDLPRAVQLIRKVRTRDPHEPRDDYTQPAKSSNANRRILDNIAGQVSGLDLARTLRFVDGTSKTQIDLPQAEDQNVMDCLEAWQLMNL